MIVLFTGPGPLAYLVRDELRERGVGADVRSEEILGRLYGTTISPAGWLSVVVTEAAAERHRTAIEEVLAFVAPEEPSEVAPATGPKARGDEVSPSGVEPEEG